MGNRSLLQGIFPAQGLNPGLPHCKRILYHLKHQGSPRTLEWAATPSPVDLPDPGIKPGLLHCRWTLYQLSYQGSPIKSNNGKRTVNNLIFLFWGSWIEVTCSYSKVHLTILYVNLNCATLVKRIRISLHSISPPLNTDILELFLSLDSLHALFKLG